MDVELRLAGPSHLEELTNLEDWLLDEPGLAGCPIDRPVGSASPELGEMGALSEVLVVALGSGGMGVALARSLSVWLRTRVGDVTLRISTGQGGIELEARNAKDAEALIKMITPLVSDGGSETA